MKVRFPASHFSSEYFSFAVLLWTERAGLAGLASQIVEVRHSNMSLDDLGSLLDLALNADPDTAIRLIGGAADAILSADVSWALSSVPCNVYHCKGFGIVLSVGRGRVGLIFCCETYANV